MYAYLYFSECSSVTPADVIFVIDESGSVEQTHFTDTINALSTTVDNLAIGENDIRVGFVLFHANLSSRSISYLNTSFDKNVIKSALSSASYAAGNDTDIASALDFTCQTMFVPNKGERSSAQNYLVLLSDGITDATQAKTSGITCRSEGITIITVGIGGTSNGHLVLKDLADYYTYPDHYLNTTYAELGTTLPVLVTSVVNCSSSGKSA